MGVQICISVCRIFWCPDLSDHRLCDLKSCKNRPDYFPCNKEKTLCIHDSLLCDGHLQCDDGSDEEFCSICPRVNSSLQRSKTFPCLHRYTKRPICANPCDGFDDLCENYEDEQCGGVPLYVVLAFAWTGTIILTLAAKLTNKYFSHILKQKCTANTENTNQSLATVCMAHVNRKVSFDDYKNLKQNEGFGNSLSNLLFYFKKTRELTGSIEMSNHYYRMEMLFNDNNSAETDMFFFETLGTGTAANQFYDYVDFSFGVKMELFLFSNVHSRLLALMENTVLCKTIGFFMFCKTVVLYYADLIKDSYLIFQIWIIMFGSNSNALLDSDMDFPVVVFWVTLASIVTSELCNLLALFLRDIFQPLGRAQKCTICLVLPLMPGIIHYHELEQKFKLANSIEVLRQNHGNISNTELVKLSEKKLSEARKTLHLMEVLRTEFRAIGNIVEHFVQLITLLLIIFLDKSVTKKVTSLDKIVLGENRDFLVFSTLMSCFSLLRGQLSYISAKKDNFLPLKGYLILVFYILVSLSVRVFTIVLCYTPILGLFNSNYHEKLGVVEVDRLKDIVAYDVGDNDELVTFEQAWDKLRLNNSEWFPTTVMFSFLPPILFILHWIVSFILLSHLQKKSNQSQIKRMSECLHSVLYPPVFINWETVYRDCKGEISIHQCWQESKWFLLSHIVLNFLHHFVLCVPLMMLKVAADRRNADLTDMFFHPLNDELYSIDIVNQLLIGGLSVTFVLPLVQCGVLYLYFTHGHLWSRILNANIRAI
jgi:hypothetical protein